MIISARPAERSDLAVLAELAGLMTQELRELRGGVVWANTAARQEPLADRFESEIDDANATLVVGTIDGVPVGFSAARTTQCHDETAIARISDLYVMPAARKVGVGEALIGAIEAWARQVGLVGLDSFALPGDRHTKNFFESFGLVARSIDVYRPIEP